VALSSAPRPKAHYRGREVEAAYDEPDSFTANEMRLLMSLVAELLAQDEGSRMSRERFGQLPPPGPVRWPR
jgi:hypothetical protein